MDKETQADELWLEVPKEIQELFCEGQAALVCRDKAIRSVFSAKRAIYYEKIRKRKLMKAWELVQELWPESRFSKITYDFNKRAIMISQ